MILGIVFILIAIVALYFIHKTDLEDDAVQETYWAGEELTNRIALHLGIVMILIIGIVSIIKDLT